MEAGKRVRHDDDDDDDGNAKVAPPPPREFKVYTDVREARRRSHMHAMAAAIAERIRWNARCKRMTRVDTDAMDCTRMHKNLHVLAVSITPLNVGDVCTEIDGLRGRMYDFRFTAYSEGGFELRMYTDVAERVVTMQFGMRKRRRVAARNAE